MPPAGILHPFSLYISVTASILSPCLHPKHFTFIPVNSSYTDQPVGAKLTVYLLCVAIV